MVLIIDVIFAANFDFNFVPFDAYPPPEISPGTDILYKTQFRPKNIKYYPQNLDQFIL
jgi:hypothetical protein